MLNRIEIHRCSKCGTIVETDVLKSKELICCNSPMELLVANSINASKEKHIPILTKLEDSRYKIVIGETRHPMTENHYIEWVKVLTKKGNRMTFFLKPGDEPEIIFTTEEDIDSIFSYCNLHGLWENKI